MPNRLLAISDLEGNHAALLAYLKGVGVVDAGGHWQWGDGHLLFNGDIVDRGDKPLAGFHPRICEISVARFGRTEPLPEPQ
jgi:hypothetical protein